MSIRRKINRWTPGLPWKGWANTWPIGHNWELDVEWVPAGRYFSFCLSDKRKA